MVELKETGSLSKKASARLCCVHVSCISESLWIFEGVICETETYLKLASCSRMLCLLSVSNPQVVPFGFVIKANPLSRVPISSLIFKVVFSAVTTLSSVKLRPLWGRNLWFASVLSIGHGPRAGQVSFQNGEGNEAFRHTIIRSGRVPAGKGVLSGGCTNTQEDGEGKVC
jgi:hypothetical protein